MTTIITTKYVGLTRTNAATTG